MSTKIAGREWIADVTGTTTWTSLGQWNVNPGLASFLVNAAAKAAFYRRYRLLDCFVEYVSRVGPYQNSGASPSNNPLGQIQMAYQRDVALPAYANRTDLVHSEGAYVGDITHSVMFRLPCGNHNNVFYTRRGSVPSGYDPRLYDPCWFQIATMGCPNSASAEIVGEIFVHYVVEMYDEIFQGRLYVPLFFQSKNSAATTYTAPISFSSATTDPSSTMILTTDTKTITFPKFVRSGRYLLNLLWFGTAGSSASITLTKGNIVPTNCTLYNSIYSVPASSILSACAKNGTAETSFGVFLYVDITGVNTYGAQASLRFVNDDGTNPCWTEFGTTSLTSVGMSVTCVAVSSEMTSLAF